MENQKKEIGAEEAGERLRAGKSLEGCVIKGTLALSGQYASTIKIEKSEISRIEANGVSFSKDVYFNEVVFHGEVNFCDSKFKGKCVMTQSRFKHSEFSGAQFSLEANFSSSKFYEMADFSKAEFNGKALFSESEFNKGAYFKNSRFERVADFAKSSFSRDGFFNEAVFCEKADFDGAKIHGHADFRWATFEGPVEFRDATVAAGAHFNYSTINGCCDFKRSKFGNFNCVRAKVSEIFNFNSVGKVGSVDFRNTIFISAANFSHTKIDDTACFALVQFEKADFSSTGFGGFADFSDATFQQQVIFQDATFSGDICLLAIFPSGAQIEWDQIECENGKDTRIRNSIKGDHIDARDEFGRLRRIFESNNNYDAMDESYEWFRRHKNMVDHKTKPIHKWLNIIFLRKCTGYGTRPLHVLLASLGVIGIFAIIYAALGGQIFRPDTIRPDMGYGWDFYLYFSLTTFFAGGVEGVRPDFEGGVKMLVAAETIMGYLLMALFVVMLARKLTR